VPDTRFPPLSCCAAAGGARHDPPVVALRLIYQNFSKLPGGMVLPTGPDAAKESEILMLRHQLVVLHAARHGRD